MAPLSSADLWLEVCFGVSIIKRGINDPYLAQIIRQAGFVRLALSGEPPWQGDQPLCELRVTDEVWGQ